MMQEKDKMSNDLQKILDYCIYLKNGYDNPMTYCEKEYYDSCKAKSEVLEDIIAEIKKCIDEKE